MPRPPLAIGTYGEIYTKDLGDGRWLARVKYRDYDGVTRPVKRHGSTKTKAINALKKALTERSTVRGNNEFSPEMKVGALWEKYRAELRRLVALKKKSPTTVDQYEGQWQRNIEKAFAELRCREVDPAVGGVAIVHDFLVKIAADSPSNAKMCRSVLSGMFGFGVPRKVLTANPARDVGTIEAEPKRQKRGMQPSQIIDFHAKLSKNAKAVRWHLPDIVTFHAGSGARIGETLAIGWENVDFDNGTVELCWRIIRQKGVGLIRAENLKRLEGNRVLRMPRFVMAMLKRRWLAAGRPTSGPAFPDAFGSWRDPSNTRRVLREVREKIGYAWVYSHVFRRAVALILEKGGATARQIADQLGHAKISMTQDNYLERGISNEGNAEKLDLAMDAWNTPSGNEPDDSGGSAVRTA